MDKQPDINPDKIDSKSEAKQAIRQLRQAIRYHNHRYYIENDPVISDADYDALRRKLETLEEAFPSLRTADSPTQRVGAEPQEKLGTVDHPTPMLSLQAVYEAADVREFGEQSRAALEEETLTLMAEPKYDGAAIELEYVDGRLQQAATRGDGETGEDVTPNVKTIRELPLVLRETEEIPVPDRLVVRGEIFMEKEAFNVLNEQRQENGKEPFANPRNAAAGSLRQLDPQVTAGRPLRIFLYEIAIPEDHQIETQEELLHTLPQWGLKSNVAACRLCTGIEEALQYHEEMENQREELPYEIDGVVFKINQLDKHPQLGTRSRSPRWAIAYKFAPRRATTEIETITVQVGRTGRLTPVAHLQPVEIGGVQVQRASLHNQSEIEAKDIRIGDKVLVERAGDVIPQVIRPLPDARSGDEETFHMPETCPVCGGDVLLSEDKKIARCTNVDCPAQLRAKLTHYTSRAGMDIAGIGEQRARQMVETGLIDSLVDLYHLEKDALAGLDGMGEKSASNLLEQIAASKDAELDRFLIALGIPHIGEHLARLLASHFSSLDSIRDAAADELTGIDAIGPEAARSVTTFFADERNQAVVEGILDAGVTLDNPLFDRERQPLSDLTFVFTGELERWTRDEVKKLVEKYGGRATGSVSGETDYVVAGPGAGAKRDAAEEENVPIWDESDFIAFLEEKELV